MRLDAIWFRYARRAPWTLRAVEAVAEPGQTVVVLGPNGAGKSTLLQVAAGILRPTRGAVRDRPAVVGWVPERFPAAQPFTTSGYLRSMAALRGLPAGHADHWIERLGLAAHAGTPLCDLSKGTAQKVGLAQALLEPPGLLVLDEPWEGLDAGSRDLIPQIVAEVTGAGGVVLVSDHRGEIASLPGAAHWIVTGGELRPAEPVAAPAGIDAAAAPADIGAVVAPAVIEADADEVIMEIAVRRREADAEMDRLRASGHRILSVRRERATAEEDR